MGVDCSGFVQNIFKVIGVRLQRDAWQQAEQGRIIDQFENAAAGDLAFFHNDSGKIIHVGILLSSGRIVHSSGKVRIDKLDKQGIINGETGKRTHRLHSVKRVID